MTHFDQLCDSDPDLAAALGDEVTRQQETRTLIASENHMTPAVLAAQGSVLGESGFIQLSARR
jgi:serine hydroxymethyltransferase (EC 2.1.2.1)